MWGNLLDTDSIMEDDEDPFHFPIRKPGGITGKRKKRFWPPEMKVVRHKTAAPCWPHSGHYFREESVKVE